MVALLKGKQIWGNICVLPLLILFKVSWFFPECLENDLIDLFIAKADSVFLIFFIMYLVDLSVMLLELCKHFSYINIPTSSAHYTDFDNKNPMSIYR